MSLHQQNFSRPLSATAIFGPGLIGGSLALALRKRRPDSRVVLWARSEESARRARRFFPEVTCDVEEAAAGVSLCVLCSPIGAMPGLARRIAPALSASGCVTDAGSVKGGVVRAMEDILGGRFVGSHPMAGSEKSGIAAARADLFEGATCIVTPTETTATGALRAVEAMWEAVGGRLVRLDPAGHDRAVGRVSHLPHAVASILVNAIAAGGGGAERLAGGGYRDTTRVAAGPPAMWAEILLENRAALEEALGDFSAALDEFKTILLSNDAPALESFLTRAKKVRDELS